MSRDKTKCHYNGSTFDLRSEIHDGTIEESCTIGCYCQNDEDNVDAQFRCTHIDCPEFFNSESNGTECIRQYDLNTCCSKGEVCGE